MRVKVIMLPFKDVRCISTENTIGEAMKIIDERNLLSLPVVNGTKFIGVLSKQYTYETYFKEFDCSKQDFLNKSVVDLMKQTVDTISPETEIEDAAAHFIKSKVRFLPVCDANNNLLGIVTQQSIFKEHQKLYGVGYDSVTIVTHDYRGVLGKICDTIAKAGGNIKNFVQVDTEVMNLQEIHVAIESEDFQKVIDALLRNTFDIRGVEYAEK